MRLTAKRKLLITVLIITLTSFFAIPFTSFATNDDGDNGNRGSIKTSDVNGVINGNTIYDKKSEVYVRADGLPDGNYWIRVMQTKGDTVLGESLTPNFVIANGDVTGAGIIVIPGDKKNDPPEYLVQLTDLVDFGDSANGVYRVEVTIDGDTIDWRGAKSDNFKVKGDPELTLEKTVKLVSDTDSPYVDDLDVHVNPATVEYQYTVENTGNVDIDDVSVFDGTILWTSSSEDLAVGDIEVFTYVYTIEDWDSNSEFINTATAGGIFDSEPVVSNESSAKVTYDSDFIADPELTIAKTVRENTTNTSFKDELLTGKSTIMVEYQFVVTNTGNVGISDVEVYDQLMGWDSSYDEDYEDVYLLPGDFTTFTKTYSISGDAWGEDSEVVNTASAGGIYEDQPVSSGTDTATVIYDETYVPSPELTIEKTVRSQEDGRGDSISTDNSTIMVEYWFRVTNTGNVDLTDVYVTDEIIGFTSDKRDIPAGEYEDFNVTFTIDSEDWNSNSQFINWASATGTYEEKGDVTSEEDDAIVTYNNPAVSHAAISIVKTVDPSTVSDRAATVTYTFLVTNEGDLELNEVSISDAAIGLVNGTALYLGNLEPGASVTTTASFSLSNLGTDGYGAWSGDTFNNIAYVYGYALNLQNDVGDYVSVTDVYPSRYIQVSDYDDATVTYSTGGNEDDNNNRRRTTTTTTVTPEPTPAAPVVETPLIEEPIPAAPLPVTGGVAPYLVYGLGLLLAGGGLAFRKKETKDK